MTGKESKKSKWVIALLVIWWIIRLSPALFSLLLPFTPLALTFLLVFFLLPGPFQRLCKYGLEGGDSKPAPVKRIFWPQRAFRLGPNGDFAQKDKENLKFMQQEAKLIRRITYETITALTAAFVMFTTDWFFFRTVTTVGESEIYRGDFLGVAWLRKIVTDGLNQSPISDVSKVILVPSEQWEWLLSPNTAWSLLVQIVSGAMAFYFVKYIAAKRRASLDPGSGIGPTALLVPLDPNTVTPVATGYFGWLRRLARFIFLPHYKESDPDKTYSDETRSGLSKKIWRFLIRVFWLLVRVFRLLFKLLLLPVVAITTIYFFINNIVSFDDFFTEVILTISVLLIVMSALAYYPIKADVQRQRRRWMEINKKRQCWKNFWNSVTELPDDNKPVYVNSCEIPLLAQRVSEEIGKDTSSSKDELSSNQKPYLRRVLFEMKNDRDFNVLFGHMKSISKQLDDEFDVIKAVISPHFNAQAGGQEKSFFRLTYEPRHQKYPSLGDRAHFRIDLSPEALKFTVEAILQPIFLKHDQVVPHCIETKLLTSSKSPVTLFESIWEFSRGTTEAGVRYMDKEIKKGLACDWVRIGTRSSEEETISILYCENRDQAQFLCTEDEEFVKTLK